MPNILTGSILLNSPTSVEVGVASTSILSINQIQSDAIEVITIVQGLRSKLESDEA